MKAVIDFIKECCKRLSSVYSPEEALAIARRALEDIYGISRTRQMTYPDEDIPTASEKVLASKHSSPAGQGLGTQGVRVSQGAHKTDNGTLNPSDVIERLASGEPIQYIAGFEYFCGEKFNVGPGVLIPRPETEELVNLIAEDVKRDFLSGDASVPNLRTPASKTPVKCVRCPGFTDTGITSGKAGNFSPEAHRSFKIFDVCTGSGCIAWSLHKILSPRFSSRTLETYGCDISDTALQYAKGQRITLDRCWPMFLHYDVLQSVLPPSNGFSVLKSFIGKLDVIVSNPPYIAEGEKSQMHKNVLDFEPGQALFVSDEDPLLFYRKIAEMARELLYPGGKLYFEINPLFAENLKQMLKEKGFCNICIISDLTGRLRFARAEHK